MNRDRLLRWILVFYGLSLLVALISLAKRSKTLGSRGGGTIVVVPISGPIMTRLKESAWSSSQDADEIAQRLRKLSEDDDVKAIILRINSPGGTVGAVQEIHREILHCREKGKKVVASMADVAASGGYYLAAAADHIVADAGTITGSIGVIMEFGNLEGLFKKIGVKLEVVKSGEHKDIGSPARPLTPAERKILQSSIDDAYQQFVDAVAVGRRMPVAKVRPLADGRIYTGRQALTVGLVDELGNRQDAIQAAIKLAGLPPKASVITDSDRSLSSVMRRMTSRWTEHPLEGLMELNSPRVEYRWR